MRSSDITLERFRDLEGTDVYDPNGEKIGAVDEVFYDNTTGVPEWISVGTGFVRLNKAVVPIEGISFAGDRIVVPFEKDRVKGSPDVGTDEITTEQERELAVGRRRFVSVGTPDQVVEDLERRRAYADADELIITTHVHDPEERRLSYELIAKQYAA